ncbi:hypothetical protein [Treponema sp.]
MNSLEIDTGRAIVRIHPGSMSEKERTDALEKALAEFFQRIHKK